jgi:hypothetical protein
MRKMNGLWDTHGDGWDRCDGWENETRFRGLSLEAQLHVNVRALVRRRFHFLGRKMVKTTGLIEMDGRMEDVVGFQVQALGTSCPRDLNCGFQQSPA